MPTYESSGSLTTVEKSYSTPQTPDLTGLVYTLNGESISVDVIGSPGEAGEETVTQSLGGATSYDLSWTSGHTDFEVVFSLSTADTSVTPEVDDLTLQGEPDAPSITVTEVTDTPDITLSWGDVATEDEYRVYRAQSPGSTLGDYTQVDTVSADTTTYVDTGVSLGTRYYYRVSAVNNAGESAGSNEVRAEPNADDLTESIAWSTETEWGYGSFTDTATDGSGVLLLSELTSVSFDYNLEGTANQNGSFTASVEISDTSSGTVLDSASVSASNIDSASDSGTFNIDVATHEDLTFEAQIDASDDVNNVNASISGPIDGSDVTIVSVNTSQDEVGDNTYTDTRDEVYEYTTTGSWTSPYWDYTNTTTATKLSWSGVTYPNGGDDITVTIESDGGNTTNVSLSSGSGSALVDVNPDDQYHLDVAVTSGSDDTTPEVGSLSLEVHTPTAGHTVVDTRSTEVDLSWDAVSVSDGYEVYYSTSTPVTSSDTLGFDTTNSGTTSGTVTGLSQGQQYYFNVRTQYSGE